MTQGPVEAQVVLTADNSQYDASMNQSAATTSQLMSTVDSLTDKLNRLSKGVGKTALGFSAADIATITTATVAFAQYEKQMVSLNVQAAALTKNTEQQDRLFKSYAGNVSNLRREFAMATSEAAELTQTITSLADNTASTDKLTTSFAKLGAATGESAVTLSQSMLMLQRTMGTPQRDTEKFNNQLFTLAQRSNASASSILEFSQNIAPVGRLVNMTQTDIMGFSNAFMKAGQDGYRASNVFNRMVSDIAYATQTGSPDLEKYANLVGLSTQRFKELGGTDQITKIFEAINRQGPAAITTLNRMGLDGMQTVRTVTAMAQQGGIASEINAARGADPEGLNRGKEAALDTLSHKLAELRNELRMTAESFGSRFAGPAGAFLGTMGKMASAVRDVTEGPLGTLTAMAAGLAAPFLAVAGAVAIAAKGLATFATAALFLRGSGARGFMEMRALSPEQRALMAARGETPLQAMSRIAPAGSAGASIDRSGNFIARSLYNTVGGVALRTRAGLPGGESYISRAGGWALTGAGGASRFFGQAIYSPGSTFLPGVQGTGGYDDPSKRMRLFQAPTFREAAGRGLMMPINAFSNTDFGKMFRLGVAERAAVNTGYAFRNASGLVTGVPGAGGVTSLDDAYKMNREFDKELAKQQRGLSGTNTPEQQARAAAKSAETRVLAESQLNKSLKDLERQSMSAGKGFANFGKGMGNLSMMMASTAVSAGKLGASLGRQAMGLFGGNYLMMGAIGAYVGYKAYQGLTGDRTTTYEDRRDAVDPYYQAGGIAAPPPKQEQLKTLPNMNTPQAYALTEEEANLAESSDYQYTSQLVKNARGPGDAEAILGAKWEGIRHNPQAVHAAAMDLAANPNIGRGAAQDILNRLSAGDYKDPFYLAEQAASAESVGKMDTLTRTRSGSEATARMNDLLGIVNAQEDYLRSTQGEAAAMEYRADALNKSIQEFTGSDAYRVSYEPIAGRMKPTDTETASVFNQQMFKQMFGFEIDEDQASEITLDEDTDLKGYLKEQLFGGGGALNPENDGGLFGWGEGEGKENLKRVLSDAGLDPDLVNDREAAYDAIYKYLTEPAESPLSMTGQSAKEMIADRTAGRFGVGGVLESGAVSYALNEGASDPNAQYKAVYSILRGIRDQTGGDFGKTMGRLQELSALAGTDESAGAALFGSAIALEQQRMAFAAPYQTRTTNFGQQTGVYQAIMEAPLGPGGEDARKQAQATYQQQVMQQYDYFKQLLYQQREYEVMRERAEEDYNLQREYAQDDFDRQRERSEFDFQLQRERAEADFQRSQRRATYDFNLSRKRQEEDYHHSVRLMVEQTARQAYDIYQRTPIQRTSSAGWLLTNAQDQLEDLRGQTRDLGRLRRMGLSDDAIQQMGLTDPKNAQQLARLVSDVAEDPRMIRQFNEAVSRRLKAAGRLVKDESSTEWQEFRRQYRLSRNRAQEDFDRSMGRSRQDFARQLDHQNDDFRRSLRRQDEDFGISMDRMAEQYNKTMDRSAEDLARAARTIDGNFEEILTRATKRLSGHAREQARQVIEEFRDLKSSTSPYAIDLMQSLSEIFGFKYRKPKPDPGGRRAHENYDSGFGPQPGYQAAAGGVLPGFTPGVDGHKFESKTTGARVELSGGEAIMVPEWTRAVGGPKAVAAMNRAARNGFAKGGVYWPVPGRDTGTYSGHDGVDINRGSGWDDYGDPIRAFRSGTIVYVGSGRGYGDAIFQRTKAGTVVYGHTSRQHVHAGQHVDAGQLIGNVGNTGNSSAPHLHFGIPGGTYQQAMALLQGAMVGGKWTPAGSGLSLGDILKDRYPKAEDVVAKMYGVRAIPEGGISGILNQLARRKYREMVDKYGRPSSGGTGSDLGPLREPAGNDLDNRQLVRRAAHQWGWDEHWPSLRALVQQESSFNNLAQNPTSTAYGLFQFLDSTWAGVGGHKTSDPWLQTKYGLRYIKDRYGNPTAAWNFHKNHNWYGDGAVLANSGAETMGVGERGGELVMPLDRKGVDFLARLMNRVSTGIEGKQSNTAGYAAPMGNMHVHTYNVDRSTTFSGGITVQANDPNEFISKLRSRERAKALANPALGGRRVG